MLSAALTLALLQPSAPKMRVVQLVFLMEGKSKVGLSSEQSSTMQAKHLNFLKGLWEERKALLVGPLEGAGRMRGLVVMDVPSRQAAVQELSKDPWISQGYLTPQAFGWYCMPDLFVKKAGFLDIEPMWFGIIRSKPGIPKLSDAENKRIFDGHMANINRMAKEGWLVSAGPTDAGKIRGVFIFKNLPLEKIKAECQQDTAIAEGRFALNLMRWYTAKDSFAPVPLEN